MAPAVDITPVQVSNAPGKGICSLPTLQLTGKYAGDDVRCLKDHSSAFTGTAGISWTPDKETLVYGRYNRGYKAFGLNAGFIGASVEAAPEYVDDFEVGLKKTMGRFVLDADAFYYNYKDAQIPIGVPVGAINVTEFINIPKSESKGVEFTAIWNPIDNLNLSLVYGYDDTIINSGCALVAGVATGSRFVDIADPSAKALGARPVGTTGAQAVSGDSLPQAPKNKIGFNANYTFRFTPGDLTLSGSYIWKDKSFDSIFTRTYDEAPKWDQVDLRATWAGNRTSWQVRTGVAYVPQPVQHLGLRRRGRRLSDRSSCGRRRVHSGSGLRPHAATDLWRGGSLQVLASLPLRRCDRSGRFLVSRGESGLFVGPIALSAWRSARAVRTRSCVDLQLSSLHPGSLGRSQPAGGKTCRKSRAARRRLHG